MSGCVQRFQVGQALPDLRKLLGDYSCWIGIAWRFDETNHGKCVTTVSMCGNSARAETFTTLLVAKSRLIAEVLTLSSFR